jgi:hypothetical protein
VIDATNALGQGRREWVAFAREQHAKRTTTGGDGNGSQQQLRLRAVEFLAPERAVLHLNAFRGLNPESPDPRMLPYPALKGILNRLQRVGVRAYALCECGMLVCVCVCGKWKIDWEMFVLISSQTRFLSPPPPHHHPPKPTHTGTQADEGFDAVEQVRGLAPGPFRHRRERHLFFSWLTK